MSREFPSMTALLGLLAVAGYQNRDKIADMLRGATQPGASGSSVPGGSARGGGGLGGLLGGLGGLFGGAAGANTTVAGGGGFLGGALGQLVDQFNRNGEGAAANSWVSRGPNEPISPDRLEKAVGPDVISTLTQHTGLSREEILARLSRELPDAVDKYTPDGRLPG